MAAYEAEKARGDEINQVRRKIDELKVSSDMSSERGAPVLKLFACQADLNKQRVAMREHSVLVKTRQKELQTATLESGECELAAPLHLSTIGWH